MADQSERGRAASEAQKQSSGDLGKVDPFEAFASSEEEAEDTMADACAASEQNAERDLERNVEFESEHELALDHREKSRRIGLRTPRPRFLTTGLDDVAEPIPMQDRSSSARTGTTRDARPFAPTNAKTTIAEDHNGLASASAPCQRTQSVEEVERDLSEAQMRTAAALRRITSSTRGTAAHESAPAFTAAWECENLRCDEADHPRRTIVHNGTMHRSTTTSVLEDAVLDVSPSRRSSPPARP